MCDQYKLKLWKYRYNQQYISHSWISTEETELAIDQDDTKLTRKYNNKKRNGTTEWTKRDENKKKERDDGMADRQIFKLF